MLKLSDCRDNGGGHDDATNSKTRNDQEDDTEPTVAAVKSSHGSATWSEC